MNSFLVGYLCLIVGFALGGWAGHEIGWSAVFIAGLSLFHWVSLFVTRNHPSPIVDGD